MSNEQGDENAGASGEGTSAGLNNNEAKTAKDSDDCQWLCAQLSKSAISNLSSYRDVDQNSESSDGNEEEFPEDYDNKSEQSNSCKRKPTRAANIILPQNKRARSSYECQSTSTAIDKKPHTDEIVKELVELIGGLVLPGEKTSQDGGQSLKRKPTETLDEDSPENKRVKNDDEASNHLSKVVVVRQKTVQEKVVEIVKEITHVVDSSILSKGRLNVKTTSDVETKRDEKDNESSMQQSEVEIHEEEGPIDLDNTDNELTSSNDALIAGPLPSSDSIFKYMRFIIIEPSRTVSKFSPPDENNGEHVFLMRHLRKQIKAGNGRIINVTDHRWFEEVEENKSLVFLIAESYSKTKTYIKAIASSLPCVSHEWIIECCVQGHRVSHKPYLLPAGLSLTKRAIVPWHGQRQILKGYYIAIKTDDDQSPNYEYWKDILGLIGATIIPSDYLYYTGILSAALVIDDYFSCSELRKLRSNNIKILRTDWVVESIIVGHKVRWRKQGCFSLGYRKKYRD